VAVTSGQSHLQQVSLRDQALAVIRRGMITGEIVPGEIYSANSLAVKLGVSNSPVRDAMLSLVNQGLMETVRNRGFRLVPLSDRDRANIYDLRVMLEVPAMGRLAESGLVDGHVKQFEDLAATIMSSEKQGDMTGYLDNDRAFHLGLLDLLGNRQLTAIVGNLRDQTRLYGLRALSESGQLEASACEHGPILDAIRDGDSDLAEQLTTKHLRHIQGDWSAGVPIVDAE
jgi:DNA-binding GntR family transcriptional regulator